MVYTGTHDNVTTEGWRTNASPEDVAYACRYLRCKPEDLTEAMICACLASVSDMAIIPLADWLHLGSEARINTPAPRVPTGSGGSAALCPAALQHIAQLTALYERTPAANKRFLPFGIRSFRLRVPFRFAEHFSAAESAAFTLFPSSVRSYSLVRSRFVHKGIIFFAASLVIFIQICYNSDNISSAFGRISRVKGAFPLWIIHIRAPC